MLVAGAQTEDGACDMTKVQQPLDASGDHIDAGDTVVLLRAPEPLLAGLPDKDQSAIKACVGETLTVISFDEFGNAEIEFVDADGGMHTIWVEPSTLRKQK